MVEARQAYPVRDKVMNQERRYFLNGYATKIIDGISKLYARYEKAAERWIWELLQNTKDCVSGDQTVMVEIVITDEYVQYRHSGKPFTIDHL
jgi:hypothetical protein